MKSIDKGRGRRINENGEEATKRQSNRDGSVLVKVRSSLNMALFQARSPWQKSRKLACTVFLQRIQQ